MVLFPLDINGVRYVIKASEMKKGMVVRFDGQLFSIVEYELVKPGKGPAYLVTTVKNVKQGNTVMKRLQGSDTLDDVFMERNEMEYLYGEANNLVFMDLKTYEQVYLAKAFVGDAVNFLTPNMKVTVTSCEGELLGLDLPPAVDLKIVETEPALRGATVTAKNKPAILETGYKVMVPAFVEPGTVVRVDTRTGLYLERAK